MSGSHLSTADYAFFISLFSAFIALTSLGWNIWSKFIYPKSKIRVWLDIRYMNSKNYHSASLREKGGFAGDFEPNLMVMPHLAMTVTNYGPGKTTISLPCMKLSSRHPRKKDGHASITAYEDFPRDLTAHSIQSGGLPTSLEEGEAFQLYFPVSDDWFTKETMVTLGIRDTLSRIHWASRKNVRRLRRQFSTHKRISENMAS